MPKITNNNPNYLSVTWEVTTTCNFACWYCADNLHDGKYRWPDLKKSQNFFNMLSKQHDTIYLSLAGGEPTLWPELVTFAYEKPSNVIVDVVTNGSRTLGWWKKASKYLESICISFHPDTADADHTIEVLKILSNSNVKNIHVWILASKASIDKCFYLYDKIVQLNLPVKVSPKTLYNMAQKHPQSVIDANNNDPRVVEFINRPRYVNNNFDMSAFKATIAYLDDEPINVPLMVADKQNTFVGWNCTIGLNRLNIVPNGDVYKGTCRIGGKIGNMFDGSYTKSSGTEICTKKFCTCVEEIRLEKWTSN